MYFHKVYKYLFPINIVQNRVETNGKTNISIVNATIRLLENAYNDTNNNQQLTHYIFLSQSCMPIYDFNTIYKTVIIDFSFSRLTCIIISI